MSHGPGNLSCAEMRELLSDLLEIRAGETPLAQHTPLHDPALRAAADLHVAACHSCRQELEALQQVGEVFGGFSVNDLPAQHFADYGAKVRARMGQAVVSAPRRSFLLGRRFWLALATSGVAAAALMFFVNPTLAPDAAREVASARPVITRRPTIVIETPKGIEYWGSDPLKPQMLRADYDPNALRQVNQQEKEFGSLSFAEPLLGVRLKTSAKPDSEGPGGVIVERVMPGGPADHMGLRPNDHIVTLGLQVNDEWQEVPVTDGTCEGIVRFILTMRQLGAGKDVLFHIVRPKSSSYLFMRPVSGKLGEYEIQP